MKKHCDSASEKKEYGKSGMSKKGKVPAMKKPAKKSGKKMK